MEWQKGVLLVHSDEKPKEYGEALLKENLEREKRLTKRTFFPLWIVCGVVLFLLRGGQILKPHNDVGTMIFGTMVLALFAGIAAFLMTMIAIGGYRKVTGQNRQ